MLAATSSPPVTMDCLNFLVSDCLVPTVNTVPACKIDSSKVGVTKDMHPLLKQKVVRFASQSAPSNIS